MEREREVSGIGSREGEVTEASGRLEAEVIAQVGGRGGIDTHATDSDTDRRVYRWIDIHFCYVSK